MSASLLHRTSTCSKQRTGSHPHTLRDSSAPLSSAPPSSEKATRRTCTHSHCLCISLWDSTEEGNANTHREKQIHIASQTHLSTVWWCAANLFKTFQVPQAECPVDRCAGHEKLRGMHGQSRYGRRVLHELVHQPAEKRAEPLNGVRCEQGLHDVQSCTTDMCAVC